MAKCASFALVNLGRTIQKMLDLDTKSDIIKTIRI